jgi:uncharacterized membrane-anchored protein YjiN (DUF445 family)
MGDHDFQPTCPSSEVHDSEISDYVLHYTSCIEISERTTFYDMTNTFWQDEIQYEMGRLIPLEKDTNKTEHDIRASVEKNIKKKIEQLRQTCDKEIRRIDYLRQIIAQDEGEKHLAGNLVNSYKDWKDEKGREERIQDISEWRRTTMRPKVS